jgi:hypothetical protein
MEWKRMSVFLLAFVMAMLECMGSAMGGSVHFADQDLPAAMVGVYYHARVKIVGDDIPYVVTLIMNPDGNNEFPSELAITPDGVIYGTPQHDGVFSFALQVQYNTDTTTFCVTKIVVQPFSEDALKAGGTDTNIIGQGNDPLTGVANGINGGRVTMESGMDTAYFVSSKLKLYAAERPYTKAAALYTAPEYRWLDSIGSDLYYYQRYYQEPQKIYIRKMNGYYVTRICRDSIGKKGRDTLLSLDNKEIMDLAVTDRIVLYIQGKGTGIMKRISLTGGGAATIRCYCNGKELQPDMVFPYNGYAYLRNAENGFLYRVYLDGQIAQALTNEKAIAYTISRMDNEDVLFYAGDGGTLYRVPLAGGDKEAFGDFVAGELNSDADFLYFANALDANTLYRVSTGNSGSPEKLTDFAVDQIYVFDTMLAVQKMGGQELYVLSKDGKETPVRIVK